MSFIETPRFPDRISYGATGGPEYRTDIVTLDSGFEQANIRWAQGRCRYQAPGPVIEQYREEWLAWFRAMKGRGHRFRLRDFGDFTCTAANGRCGVSPNATGYPTYQLAKYYATGSLEEYRRISKPAYQQPIALYRGGVLASAGASAGNYALDTTTGIVTFVADSTQNVSAVTGGATTSVTLAGALSGLAIGGQLYLSGIVGTIATALNGIAHPIANIVGAVYTLSTVTTGLTRTSGGAGFKYPQSTEALTWVGLFDVPVRFDADYGQLTIEAPGVFRADQVSLIEVRV